MSPLPPPFVGVWKRSSLPPRKDKGCDMAVHEGCNKILLLHFVQTGVLEKNTVEAEKRQHKQSTEEEA